MNEIIDENDNLSEFPVLNWFSLNCYTTKKCICNNNTNTNNINDDDDDGGGQKFGARDR